MERFGILALWLLSDFPGLGCIGSSDLNSYLHRLKSLLQLKLCRILGFWCYERKNALWIFDHDRLDLRVRNAQLFQMRQEPLENVRVTSASVLLQVLFETDVL